MSVFTRRNKRGKTIWCARRMVQGEQTFKSFGTGSEAKNTAYTWDAEMASQQVRKTGGARSRKNSSKTAFRAVANEFLPVLQSRNRNLKDKKTKATRMDVLIDRYGSKMLDEFTPSVIEGDLQPYLEAEGNSPKTINDWCYLFSSVFHECVKNRYIEYNPVQPWKERQDPVPDEEKRNPLTRTEWRLVESLLRKDAWFSDAVYGALQTGMRQSELIELDWDCVDTNGWTELRVKARNGKNAEGGFTTKSKKGYRRIPLTPKLIEILKRNHFRKTSVPFPGPDDDKRIAHSTLTNRWYQLQTSIKKKHDRDWQRRGWHQLRHTYGSWNGENEIPVQALMYLMGHSSLEQTLAYMNTKEDWCVRKGKEYSPFNSGTSSP